MAAATAEPNNGPQDGAETRSNHRQRTQREQIDPASVAVSQEAAEVTAVTAVGAGEATKASLRKCPAQY